METQPQEIETTGITKENVKEKTAEHVDKLVKARFEIEKNKPK